MAKPAFPAAGTIQGGSHMQTRFLTDGRSLHPDQRLGVVPHSGYGNKPAGSVSGAQHGPWVPPMSLEMPHTLTPSIIAATRTPAVRV